MPADLLKDLQAQFAWAPGWAISLAVIAFALAVALYGYQLAVRGVRRGLGRKGAVARSLILRTKGPVRLALVIAAISWGVQIAPFTDKATGFVQHGLLVAFIILCGWALMTSSDIATAFYLRRHAIDTADNLHARKMLTQARILRRSLNVLVLIVTVAMALMTIPGVKQLGVSLLAAGGAAGIILGLALQPLLSNIIAGIQIAFTQPIRIGDAVTVQNEFGHVEEIKSTYVVIRLRDLRRLIVPLKFFLDQPFQNWTRESSGLVPEVIFQVDQRVPLDRLRVRIEEAARASGHWDGGQLKVQVNNILEKTMEIRVLASARNATEANDLRAAIREGVVTWLQREQPGLLPAGITPSAEPPSDTGAGPGGERVQ